MMWTKWPENGIIIIIFLWCQWCSRERPNSVHTNVHKLIRMPWIPATKRMKQQKLSGVVGAIIYNMNILNKHDRTTQRQNQNEWIMFVLRIWSGIKAR